MSRVAIIDSQVAGIAGDMLLSSLVDAGANKTKVIEAIFACQNFVKDSRIINAHFAKVISHSFAATQLQMKCKDDILKRKGSEMYSALARCCDSVGLGDRAKTFALDSLKMIISAEATIHGQNFDSVHLHEASSIDTFADLVGCATALQDLQLFDAKIYSTKVAVGGGLLRFSHGTIPNPTSAILEIFKNKQFVYVVETNIDDVSGELVGNLVEQLAEVAKDVTVISGTTKKSRPTYLIRIISENTQLNSVLELLFDESG